jgi:hypothetical protein
VSRGDELRVAAELAERGERVASPLGGPPLALEHEAAHRFVDTRQVSVEELLGVVRLGRHERPLAELERRLLRRRPGIAGAGDHVALMVGRERRSLELLLDSLRKLRDVAAAKRRERGDRGCVARRVAPTLLDLRRRHDHVVARDRNRALGFAGDDPLLTLPSPHRLQGQFRRPFVADRDEHVGVPLGP